MEYQLNPSSPFSLNGTPSDNGDGTFSQPVIINPMIVGDTYGFISPAPSKNMFTAKLPSTGLDYEQLKAAILPLAEAFCSKQYPNT